MDSTNICAPLVSVITSISFDHTKQLGNTLAAIAHEKAGIIKPGVPVVSGVMNDEPREVIRRTARERGCRLVELEHDFSAEYYPALTNTGEDHASRIDFVTHGMVANSAMSVQRLVGVKLGMVGRHQGTNAAIALAVAGELSRQGWRLPEHALRVGLARARLPARIECLGRRPTLVIDGAHNVASIEALIATLQESFPAVRRVLIFATTKEKDVRGMLTSLLPCFDQVIFTRYLSNPRGVPVEELLTWAEQLAVTHCTAVPTPSDAWNLVRSQLGPQDLLCVTGSFFIAAEVRQEVLAQGIAVTPQAC